VRFPTLPNALSTPPTLVGALGKRASHAQRAAHSSGLLAGSQTRDVGSARGRGLTRGCRAGCRSKCPTGGTVLKGGFLHTRAGIWLQISGHIPCNPNGQPATNRLRYNQSAHALTGKGLTTRPKSACDATYLNPDATKKPSRTPSPQRSAPAEKSPFPTSALPQ